MFILSVEDECFEIIKASVPASQQDTTARSAEPRDASKTESRDENGSKKQTAAARKPKTIRTPLDRNRCATGLRSDKVPAAASPKFDQCPRPPKPELLRNRTHTGDVPEARKIRSSKYPDCS